MDDHKLDDLFRDGLNNSKSFDNAERQWSIVSKRIGEKEEKKPLGLWLWLSSSIGLLALALLVYSTSVTPTPPPTTVSANNEEIIEAVQPIKNEFPNKSQTKVQASTSTIIDNETRIIKPNKTTALLDINTLPTNKENSNNNNNTYTHKHN